MKKSKTNLSLKGRKKITFPASHKRKYITSTSEIGFDQAAAPPS